MHIDHFYNYGTYNEVQNNYYGSAEDKKPEVHTREEKFLLAVKKVTEDKLVKHKSDWIIVKQALEDSNAYDKIQFTSFAEMLKQAGIGEEIQPSGSLLGKVIIKSKGYLDWQIEDKRPDDMKRLTDLAKAFMKYFTES